MVVLPDAMLINGLKLGDKGRPLQGARGIQVWDVPHDEIPAGVGKRVALLQQATNVGVMIGQCD